jgi:hypothetical protein
MMIGGRQRDCDNKVILPFHVGIIDQNQMNNEADGGEIRRENARPRVVLSRLCI